MKPSTNDTLINVWYNLTELADQPENRQKTPFFPSQAVASVRSRSHEPSPVVREPLTASQAGEGQFEWGVGNTVDECGFGHLKTVARYIEQTSYDMRHGIGSRRWCEILIATYCHVNGLEVQRRSIGNVQRRCNHWDDDRLKAVLRS